jgi:hypothetical protein
MRPPSRRTTSTPTSAASLDVRSTQKSYTAPFGGAKGARLTGNAKSTSDLGNYLNFHTSSNVMEVWARSMLVTLAGKDHAQCPLPVAPVAC